MAVISTRQGLIDYCLRRLGDPVIEINVDVDQIEDKVDDGLMSRQVTPEERAALSDLGDAPVAEIGDGLMSPTYDEDRMKDINTTADTGNTIIASSYLKDNSIAENGVFSQDALETAVSNTTDNTTFNAMLLGNIAKETGGAGPVTEIGLLRLLLGEQLI